MPLHIWIEPGRVMVILHTYNDGEGSTLSIQKIREQFQYMNLLLSKQNGLSKSMVVEIYRLYLGMSAKKFRILVARIVLIRLSKRMICQDLNYGNFR